MVRTPPGGHGPVRGLSGVATLIATLLASAFWNVTADAQAHDSVAVIAGPRYVAGPMKRLLLGEGYRDLWTTPIRVPVLRPDTFAGGLTVLERGNSLSTMALRFAGADGREYVFRSVDKEQARELPDDLQNSIVSYIVQDLVAAKHPAAALVVAPLLEAAGVLHAPPTLIVLADHPLLGEHRATFAGMLGTIEIRPNESGEDDMRAESGGEDVDAVNFARYPRIIGEERLAERLAASTRDRVDSRAYLTARLVDILVGDWDRHPDQWRWAQADRGETRFWLPIPRDRDNALWNADGFIAIAAGILREGAVSFDDRYSNLYGLVHNAQPLDRPILAELPLSVWDSIAMDLHDRLTDDVIATAVARMPAEWAALEGVPLTRKLKSRRDALPRVARAFYSLMATEVDVYATDEGDRASVEYLGDGSTHVRLSTGDAGGEVYFDRRFSPAETREVRIHLGAGDDRAEVHGRGGAILVRLIGGEGNDWLEDRSMPRRGTRVALHDHAGDDRLVAGPTTAVDRRAFEPAGSGGGLNPNEPPPRDWGSERALFTPRLGWAAEIGPVLGGGPTWTRFGFRRNPYAFRGSLAFLYAPLHGRPGVEAGARFLRTGGGGETSVTARVSRISATRFHGFGNEAPAGPDGDRVRVWATEYSFSSRWVIEFTSGVRLGAGPNLESIVPEPVPGSPAAEAGVAGSRPFSVAGLGAEASLDLRDSRTFPTRGALLRVNVIGYPFVDGDVHEPFGRGDLWLGAYLPVPGTKDLVLAMRGGGQWVGGVAPIQHAASLGGSSSLRGHPSGRFTGDRSVHAGSELRMSLGRANLRLTRAEVGALALADVGRVFVPGEESRRWHHAFGGGLWFRAIEGVATAHVVYSYGERHTIHLGTGLPY